MQKLELCLEIIQETAGWHREKPCSGLPYLLDSADFVKDLGILKSGLILI